MSFDRCALAVAGLLFATSCAARGPSSATQASSAGSSNMAPPAIPSPPEETLTWQAIPFPDASFTGKVLAARAPSAFRAGELLVIWIPFTSKVQARCTVVRSELDQGGSIEALVAAPGTVGARLRDLSVEGLEVSSDSGMLSLLAKRDNGAWVEVAGYRDRRKALVCAADGSRDLPAFRKMAESLVVSLQPADAPPPPSVVELCVTKVGDGAPGFERTEIIEDGARTLTRATGFVAFRDGPTGLDLMEQSEDEVALEGRVAELRTVRLFGGRTDLDARLTRDSAGRYRAFVTGRRGQRYDGPLRVRTSEGLPSRGAIRERIKSDLLGRGEEEVRIEAFDPIEMPLEAPAEAAVRTYARGAGPGQLTMTEGSQVSRQVVDADGFVQSEEASLAAGTRRSSTCHRERPAAPVPERTREPSAQAELDGPTHPHAHRAPLAQGR